MGVLRTGLPRLDRDLGIVAQGNDKIMRQRGVDLHGKCRVLVLENRRLVGLDAYQHKIATRARGAGFISHGGTDLGFVQGQFLELPYIRTANRIDRIDHRQIGAHVDVVRRGNGNRTSCAVGRYLNNGLAIAEGEIQR